MQNMFTSPREVRGNFSSMRNGPRLDPQKMERERRAAALPDALFDDNPEVQRLRTLVADQERRCRHLMSIEARGRLEERSAALNCEIQGLRAELVGAAIDAAFDDSPRFVDLRRQIDRAELMLEAVVLARDELPRREEMQHRQSAILRNAQNELAELSKRLKLERVEADEQGELPL